jgi:hypothetical protein
MTSEPRARSRASRKRSMTSQRRARHGCARRGWARRSALYRGSVVAASPLPEGSPAERRTSAVGSVVGHEPSPAGPAAHSATRRGWRRGPERPSVAHSASPTRHSTRASSSKHPPIANGHGPRAGSLVGVWEHSAGRRPVPLPGRPSDPWFPGPAPPWAASLVAGPASLPAGSAAT